MGPKRSSWEKLAGHRRLAVMLAATIGLWTVEFGLAGHVARGRGPGRGGYARPPPGPGGPTRSGVPGRAPARRRFLRRGAVPRECGRDGLRGPGHDGCRQQARRGTVRRPVDQERRLPLANRPAQRPDCVEGAAGEWADVRSCLRPGVPGGVPASAAPRPEVREKMAKAVELIVKSQNRDGGWRYQPKPLDADLSVTVTQLSALLAARDGGINVPEATIRQAVAYVKKSQNADGGFRYLIQGGTSGFARSAAAVAVLFQAAGQDGPEVRKGLDYLLNVSARRQHRPAGGVLLLWPLLCGPSHQPCRLADLGSLVPGRPRRLAGATGERRLLARCGVGRSRHGHGLLDAPDETAVGPARESISGDGRVGQGRRAAAGRPRPARLVGRRSLAQACPTLPLVVATRQDRLFQPRRLPAKGHHQRRLVAGLGQHGGDRPAGADSRACGRDVGHLRPGLHVGRRIHRVEIGRHDQVRLGRKDRFAAPSAGQCRRGGNRPLRQASTWIATASKPQARSKTSTEAGNRGLTSMTQNWSPARIRSTPNSPTSENRRANSCPIARSWRSSIGSRRSGPTEPA